MSEKGQAEEGQMVESRMSAEELAHLSDPRPTEGEAPNVSKEFGNVSIDDVEDSYKDADAQADDREDIPTEASEEE